MSIKSNVYAEMRLSLDQWIPGGFGTADAVKVWRDTDRPGVDNIVKIAVVDYKYGRGVRVSAQENEQLMLYGLAACDLFLNSKRHEHQETPVELHIVQPRMNWVDKVDVTAGELWEFGGDVANAAAEAIDPLAELVPGEKQCRWCRARAVCKARTGGHIQWLQQKRVI